MNLEIVLIAGVVIGAIISVYFQALKGNGAVAAIIVGFSIILGTELRGLLLLGLFFTTSTIWSKYRQHEKAAVKDMVEKGDVRDYAQVLANGGVPAIFSLLFAITGSEAALFAFAVSLASANADTWASEIGVCSKRDPILLFSGRRVPKGTSGAISLLGTVAGLSGSGTIALASLFLWPDIFQLSSMIGIAGWGFFNMLLDSLIGHTLQEKRHCPQCGKMTEKLNHCGRVTSYKKGIPRFNNDWVNFTSILLTTLFSFFFFQVI